MLYCKLHRLDSLAIFIPASCFKHTMLTLWHKVAKEEVANYSQFLVDVFALKTEDGITTITEKLVEEMKGRRHLEKIFRSKKIMKQREDATSLSHFLFRLLKQGRIALFNKKRYQYYRTSFDFHNRNLSNANLQGVIGPPASAKSLFMLEVEKKLIPSNILYYTEGGATTKAGIQKFIAENQHKEIIIIDDLYQQLGLTPSIHTISFIAAGSSLLLILVVAPIKIKKL